jgi:3-hydroxybutyryl-CoA dehydrogenase
MMNHEKGSNISIIGAGTMGSGIAIALAKCGFKPTLIELAANLAEINGNVLKMLDQNKIDPNSINITNDLNAVDGSQIIIEAIIEDFKSKATVFQKVGKICPADTILASNTSSLSINELSREVPYPANFIGLHFFNPPYLIDFVEIVPGEYTSEATTKNILGFVDKLKKKSIVVKDSPGFIVNRLLFVMINEAAFLLQNKVACARDINMAMKLGAGYPMGPLAIADLIGIDVCFDILESLNSRIPNGKYEPCPLFNEMIKNGYLGRKVKKGFYNLDIADKGE